MVWTPNGPNAKNSSCFLSLHVCHTVALHSFMTIKYGVSNAIITLPKTSDASARSILFANAHLSWGLLESGERQFYDIAEILWYLFATCILHCICFGSNILHSFPSAWLYFFGRWCNQQPSRLTNGQIHSVHQAAPACKLCHMSLLEAALQRSRTAPVQRRG